MTNLTTMTMTMTMTARWWCRWWDIVSRFQELAFQFFIRSSQAEVKETSGCDKHIQRGPWSLLHPSSKTLTQPKRRSTRHRWLFLAASTNLDNNENSLPQAIWFLPRDSSVFEYSRAPGIPQFCMCASPRNGNILPTHPAPPAPTPSSHPWPHRRQQRFRVQHKFWSCFRPAGNWKRNTWPACALWLPFTSHVLSSPPRVLQNLRRIDCSHPCLQREPALKLPAEGESSWSPSSKI